MCGTLSPCMVLYLHVWYSVSTCVTLSPRVVLYLHVWYSISMCGTLSPLVSLYLHVWYSSSTLHQLFSFSMTATPIRRFQAFWVHRLLLTTSSFLVETTLHSSKNTQNGSLRWTQRLGLRWSVCVECFKMQNMSVVVCTYVHRTLYLQYVCM